MPAFRCLILDLDGTVIDSHATTFAAIRHACAPFDLAPDDATIYARFGPDERIILAGLVGARHADAAYARLQRYTIDHLHAVAVHVEMRALLDDCRRQAISTALFTGRGSDSTRLLLAALDLARFFDAVVTGDMVPPKPQPDGILQLLSQLQCVPGETLVVGDSSLDLEAASRAGTAAVLATWFTSAATATRALGVRIATPLELRAVLQLAASRPGSPPRAQVCTDADPDAEPGNAAV